MNRRHFMRAIGGVVAGATGVGAILRGPATPKIRIMKYRSLGPSMMSWAYRRPEMILPPAEYIHPDDDGSKEWDHPWMLMCSDGKVRPFHECDHTGRVTYEIKGIKA